MPDIKVQRRTITLAEEAVNQLFKSKDVGVVIYMLLFIKKGRVDFTLCLGIQPSSRVHIVALLSMEAA